MAEMPLEEEMWGSGSIDGKEALRMPRRFRPTHAMFPSPSGLVGFFRTVSYVNVTLRSTVFAISIQHV
jgi:hypothetical protein